MFRSLVVRQAVQATPNPLQQASGGQARQDNPGRIDRVQIAGAKQSFLADKSQDSRGVSIGKHDVSMFRLFV